MTALRSWKTVRLSLVRERADEPIPGTLREGRDVAALLRAFRRDDPREGFVAIYLDNRHRPLAMHLVSLGTVDCALVSPREVFGPALMLSATSVIVAHNHPSGDPTPSPEDRSVTERLRQAGGILGVELLDHIVLGSERFFSFAQETTEAYAS